MSEPTFVITLKLDDPSFAILQALRQRFFPAERNMLPAHLTLLHTVSVDQVSSLTTAWKTIGSCAPVPLMYAALRLLGNGVAINVDSKELTALRASLVEQMPEGLTRQDQQRFRAHVTIQNKVSPAEAKELFRLLATTFEPWYGVGTDVLVWKYLGGPWQPELQLPLRGPASLK